AFARQGAQLVHEAESIGKLRCERVASACRLGGLRHPQGFSRKISVPHPGVEGFRLVRAREPLRRECLVYCDSMAPAERGASARGGPVEVIRKHVEYRSGGLQYIFAADDLHREVDRAAFA